MKLYHQHQQFYPARKLPKIFIYGLFAFIIAACTSSADVPALPTLVEFPTEATIESSSATEEPESGFVTQEADPDGSATEEPAVTPDIFVPADSVRYQTEDGSLFVVVTTLGTEETMTELPDAPDGEKYVLLSTTLANFTGEPIMVESGSLTLIDQQFNRYAVLDPDDFLRSTLYGVEFDGRTMQGAIRFLIPEDARPYLLEWCPYNDCEIETLQTFLP